MDFYCGRWSGNSARSAFALEEAKVAYDVHVLDTSSGENKSAAYLAINPMGKIPALVDGALRLWESNAINWYVAEKNPGARLLPGSIEGRASVHRWLFFQTGHVTPACVQIFRQTNARVKAFWNPPDDPRSLEAGRKELARYLPVLESALGKGEWLEGAVSLADIADAPHLALIAEGGFDFAPHPAVRAWLSRMLERPAWRKAAELILR